MQELSACRLDLPDQRVRLDPQLGCDLGDGSRDPQDIRAFPVAFGSSTERDRCCLRDHGSQILVVPNVVATLPAVAVGILRAHEPPRRGLQLSQEILGYPHGHVAMSRLAREEPRLCVELDQLRVVRQHLLEVRDVPSPVRAVPGEPSAGLVVDTPGGHAIECGRCHLERLGVHVRSDATAIRARSAAGTSGHLRIRPSHRRTRRSILANASSTSVASIGRLRSGPGRRARDRLDDGPPCASTSALRCARRR